jgi:hypothetical protein
MCDGNELLRCFLLVMCTGLIRYMRTCTSAALYCYPTMSATLASSARHVRCGSLHRVHSDGAMSMGVFTSLLYCVP